MKALIFTFLIIISSCKQQAERKETDQIETEEIAESATENKMTILQFDSSWYWIFENAKPTELSQLEIDEIEPILKKSHCGK